MEEIKVNLTNLTGAMNRLIEEIRSIENRVNRIEQGSDVAELKRRLELLEQPSSNDATETVEAATTLQVPRTEEDLRSISRLPDSVKELRTFDGNPLQYVSWVHSVEMILKDFEIVKNKPIYRSIMQSIRQKVVGEADAALVSYNIFDSEWKDLKKILSLHYADKRDIQTLEHQLNQLSQGSSKVDEFYSTVNHQLSLIINKLKTENYSEETINALIATHRNRALDIFIRGLIPELSKMVIIQRPRTLPEAYSACLELQNLTMRNNILHSKGPPRTSAQTPHSSSGAPPRPPRTHYTDNKSTHYRRNNWQQGRNAYRYNNQDNYDSQPKPAPPPKTHHTKPEAMDVDRSIQSKKVNYMNRPRQAEKRSASEMYGRDKHPRLYHLPEDYDKEGVCDKDEAEPQDAEYEDFDDAASERNFMEGGPQGYLT